MKVSKAGKLWLEYHQCHFKENSISACKLTLNKFCDEFGDENIKEITTERALSFLNRVAEGKKLQTKKTC